MANFPSPPDSDDVDVWATHYAMIIGDSYVYTGWGHCPVEAEQNRIREMMIVKFGAYQTQEAIKRAHETLKIVDFHKEN